MDPDYELVGEKADYPLHMGFIPDFKTVKASSASRQTNSTLFEEKIITKIFRDDDIGQFIENEKRAGVDNLIREIQNQLNKWRKESNSGG